MIKSVSTFDNFMEIDRWAVECNHGQCERIDLRFID